MLPYSQQRRRGRAAGGVWIWRQDVRDTGLNAALDLERVKVWERVLRELRMSKADLAADVIGWETSHAALQTPHTRGYERCARTAAS